MKFTNEQWFALSRLLDEALALPGDERQAWLEALPAETGGLKSTLRELLAHDSDAETHQFLRTLPRFRPTSSIAEDSVGSLRAGAVVGPYRLLRELGHGGMGAVWLAERTDGVLKRPVALKLPHPGMHGAELAQRFTRERDILAALTHPHIARLYDAGVTADGQPFLALEYVDGQPLIAYCDAHRLDLTQRLDLFLQVLSAVQYAHAHLVVHRDIKPSNVLVTPDGQVRLLDFGIAKLIAEEAAAESELTQAAGRLLTPDYASPEQISGAPLTTATDIYSLGVMLYELLTGERPYRLKRDSRGALEEAILEAEVARPSAACKDAAKAELRELPLSRLQKALRGDLDTIVLAALKKSPAERYPSVTAFAEDIRHYLTNEPVSARPDSLGYRAAKFVRRNRLAVGLSTLAVLALIAGLVGTITQERSATEQRDFALRELSRAAAMNDLNEFLLSDAAPSGKPFTAGELLSRAEAIVERQQAESDATRAEMLVAIGRQYSSTDQDDEARRLLGQAYEMSRKLPDSVTRARAACALAPAVGSTGDRERAEALLREGLADLPDEPQFTLDRISCLLNGSTAASDASGAPRAIERAEAAQALLPRLRYPSTVLELNVVMHLAAAYDQANQFTKAVEMYERAHSRLVALGRENTLTAGHLYNYWGVTLHLMGQTLKAEETLRKAVQIASADGTDRNVSPMRYTNLSRTLLDLEKNAEASHDADLAYDRARAAGDEVVVTQSLLMRARAYRNLGDLARSEQMTNESQVRAERPGADPILFASVGYERAMLAQARGDGDAAMSAMDKAVAIAVHGPDEEATAVFVLRRAELERDLGRFDRAKDDAERASKIFLSLSGQGAPSSYVGRCYLVEGSALQASGRIEEGRRMFVAAIEQLRPTYGSDHPKTKLAEQLLASARAGDAPSH
jgi:serine/threonine-protein kinase